jgi:hypothetical protein
MRASHNQQASVMHLRLALIGAMAVAVACTTTPTEPPAIVDYNVLVQTAKTEGEVSFAGVTMRATARNLGVRSVFLVRCGDVPLVLSERFENDAWHEEPAPDCAPSTASGPIVLESGASISADRAFGTIGRYRMSVMVDSSSFMTTTVRVWSLRFDIR